MSFDGIATFAAVKELQDNLTLGKIEKIYQPQPEQLLFNIHTKSGNKKLFISVSGSHSAVYLVDKPTENPASPPVFCMVLRKHLSAGRITKIKQYQNDRIIEIFIETVNELGFSVNKKLIIEIMGKHSNALLVNTENNKIIDSIKHVSIDVNRARQILPGKLYEYPPAQNKIPFTEISCNDIQQALEGQLQPARALLSRIQGISPAFAETLAETTDSHAIYEFIQKTISSIKNGTAKPVVYKDEKGSLIDFHITPLSVYDNSYISMYFDTFSKAVSYYFQNKESSNTVKQKSNDLLRLINNHLDKLYLKIQKLNEDLFKAENSDKYRLYGELLTANIHMVKQGSSYVNVINYYDGKEIQIPLDKKYSPSKNAQNYYKKYGKAKTAVKEKKIQLNETQQEIKYLESVSSFAAKANSIEEVDLLKQELIDSGFIRYKKTNFKQNKNGKPKPYLYEISSGKSVMAGRNNKENDWLTMKKASSSDIWFHTKDIPGSHVILFTNGTEPTEADLFETASIAAFHSKGSDSENVPVDYTKVRHVKKPAGAKPGMVIFTHNKTLYVNPRLPE